MKYRINNQIGAPGGFGRVHKCTSENGGEYAIKFLEDTSPASIDRFKKEIRLTMRLSHPNIIKIIAYDADGSRKWYIMPLYKSSLNAVIPDLYGQYARQYNIISEILNGVIYLHSEGVLHRDLKPQNILYNSDSDIVINDFGLGRQLDSDSTRLTRLGDGFGTMRYTSPEQMHDARNADERSDIFSLGKIIEDIVTGSLTNPIPTEDLEYIITKSTHTNPLRRFGTVTELKSAIDSVYQALLGIIENNITDELLTKLKLGIASSKELSELATKLLATRSGDKIEEFFRTISDQSYQEFERSDLDLAENLVNHLQQYYTGQGWGFGYTDTIGSNCERLYKLSNSPAAKANLLYTIIEVGISHNRWYVMRIASSLLKLVRSDVPQCLELASLLDEYPVCLKNLDVEYDELPTCLQPFYNNT